MDIFIMQHKSRYSVVMDGDLHVHKYEKCKFDQPFLSFRPKNIFIGKSGVCEMTEITGAADNS